MTVVDDITAAELEEDPYPFYERLRRTAPVAYVTPYRQWFITRWDDCEAVAKDETRLSPQIAHLDEFFGPSILTSEGDVHKWLRGGVDPPLRPRAVQQYIEQRARPVCAEYVERLKGRGQADATVDLLERISVRVIGDVLGFSDLDDETLQRWFHGLSAGLSNRVHDNTEVSAYAKAIRDEVDDHVAVAIERVTGSLDGSGLSHMVHSGLQEGQPPRTYEDLIGTIRVIVLGGFQEPGHGAAASLLGLLSKPAQLEAVREQPEEMIPKAVHEGLRWLAPFGFVERRTRVDITVAGVPIPAGSEVILVCASANRDESRYEDGDQFDVFRPRQSHASFGYGAHFCSGHFISRRLEQIMLEEILSRLPGLRLDPERPAVVRGCAARGVKSLPVLWSTG
jgi:cytochrome P450